MRVIQLKGEMISSANTKVNPLYVLLRDISIVMAVWGKCLSSSLMIQQHAVTVDLKV